MIGRVLRAVVFVCLGGTASAAVVEPVNDFLNTGVGGSGAVLPPGSSAQNWRLVSSPNGLTSLTVGAASPFYAQAPVGSQWITPGALSDNDPVGEYRLELDFTLSPRFDPATALLSASVGGDNRVTLFLNGEQATTPISTFGTLTDVVIRRGFQAGDNLLVAVLTNDPIANRFNPAAFLFSNAVVTADPIPEPGALLVLAPLSLLLARRRASIRWA